jgi:hypothetical protein
MKLVFFCGALEAGRNGVGDYTRRLAAACVAQGVDCTVIALHDPYVTRTSDRSAGNVRLLRLPAAESWPDRLATAARQLRLLEPDWVSWQLVAQAFHPRGFLPTSLLKQAPTLRGTRCHVMMHELWLGLETGASWRSRGIGWLQRRGLLCLLDQLDPDCLHTSNPAYQQALATEGYDAGILSLFGNIPVDEKSSGPENPLTRWLPDLTRPESAGARPLVALTFGTLHPQWHPAATVKWFAATAQRLGRTPALVALGRIGDRGAKLLSEFRRQGIPVGLTGELADAYVSQLLRTADFGIAPHPWALMGKSGAAAAMLDHGLPVLVPRDEWHLRGGTEADLSGVDRLLARLKDLDAAATDRWLARRQTPRPALPRVTAAFLKSLEMAPLHLVPATR